MNSLYDDTKRMPANIIVTHWNLFTTYRGRDTSFLKRPNGIGDISIPRTTINDALRCPKLEGIVLRGGERAHRNAEHNHDPAHEDSARDTPLEHSSLVLHRYLEIAERHQEHEEIINAFSIRAEAMERGRKSSS